MRYLSVCSGIEAASVAWHDLSWTPVAFSEIEAFPSAVLAHHYPTTPNWGDMTKFKEWPDACRCVSNRQHELSVQTGQACAGNWGMQRPAIHTEQKAPSCGGDHPSKRGFCETCGGAIFDVLVGGTPCQSFSVAGLRKGLADPRGNLMLTYLAIADRYRPEWLVWENVPGVLSSNGGRDFASLLRGMAELGYGFSYRILDAQYFGVAQRRRRVFVVANARSWQRAAAVLFERHSLSGDSAPSRKKGKEASGTFTARTNISRNNPEHLVHGVAFSCSEVGPTMGSSGPPYSRTGNERVESDALAISVYGIDGEQNATEEMISNADAYFIPMNSPVSFSATMSEVQTNNDLSSTLQAKNQMAVALGEPVPYDFFQITAPVNSQNRSPGDPCHTLARDNAAHATIMQSIAIQGTLIGSGENAGPQGSGADVSGAMFTLTKMDVHAVAIGLDEEQNARVDGFGTLKARMEGGGFQGTVMTPAMQVRRLTPVECERLQGFPDNYTAVPYRNKPASDGPRYKALGNSMAVPVMRWIGERIQKVLNINEEKS